LAYDGGKSRYAMVSKHTGNHGPTRPETSGRMVRWWRQAIRAGIASAVIGFISFALIHEAWYSRVMPYLGDPPMSNPHYETYRLLAVQAYSWGGPFFGGLVAGLMLGWLGVPVGIGATGLWVGALMFLRGWGRALRYQTAHLLHNEPLVLLLAFAPGAAVGAAIGAWLRSRISKQRLDR